MPSIDLASHPVVPTEYGRWQPLNEPLGLTAFGISAMVCDPGEEFDIEHTEADTGQQETYVVVTGRARFRIGSDHVEAGPGTVVSVPDPQQVRSYEALEPATRIVCVGAAPSPADADAAYGVWITEGDA